MEVYDMPRGWKQQELWRGKAYLMWKSMWRRVFNPNVKYWNDCEIWEDFKFFSNFLSWLESQPRFEEFCSTCHEIGWSIDKDMKVKGNKKYFPEFMSLVTKSENSREMLERNGNPRPKRPIIAISSSKILLFHYLIEARSYGFNKGNIIRCLKGERKLHKGYKWKYINYKHGRILRYVK